MDMGRYYHFGSADSLDTDVLVEVPAIGSKQDAYDRIRALRGASPEGWNINLIVVSEGRVTATVSSNGTADGLNNALFYTYDNHLARQKFPNPIDAPVPRNLALATYRALRCMLTYCTRTPYRSLIKACLKGMHPFEKKPQALSQIDFASLESFGNKYSQDTEIWKSLAFYLGQTLSLLRDGEEIYTKSGLLTHHPTLAPFVRREPLTRQDKEAFNQARDALVALVDALELSTPMRGVLVRGDEIVDMIQEVALDELPLPS